MSSTRFCFEVYPQLPEALARLEDIANDLLYSWDRQVRGLFYRLDVDLWERCGHNPKVFLHRISQARLQEVLLDRNYMDDYARVISMYDRYHGEEPHPSIESLIDHKTDLVAYFCAEFGFHESFPIYSGGLGILAGDHCKAASDLGVPFVAVGLLYQRGYFNQTIDNHGQQIAQYAPTNINNLPAHPALDANGRLLKIQVPIGDRQIKLKVWEAKAGHIKLLLLDSNDPDNSEEDRSITFQLYGGDRHVRIKQEIVLGIGGVRALRALNLAPTIWHINEGHPAFQIIERCREKIEQGLSFDAAMESVAAATVFTTHTPVAAGHDSFEQTLMEQYLSHYVFAELKIHFDAFLQLGSTPENHHSFNMTAFALRGSRFHNGVSKIHGDVASKMEGHVWPQIPANENPMSYVTNGVHVPTFLAREWVNLFDIRFRDWRNELLNDDYWQCIDDIPDHRYWSLHQSLKTEMLDDVCQRATFQHRRNGASEAMIRRITHHLSEGESDILVLGFARRFATYKRATLIFSDLPRLSRILNNPGKPVILIFAGKAHPQDIPGQKLIETIHRYSQQPEFIGKVILLEGYDMGLARKLVTGCDVWINTPEYPLEASGTSGQKAGINGVINLSVLDGWWGEGYSEDNGWAIAPHNPSFDPTYRYQEEANDLLDILEKQVVPLYYSRDSHGYSADWVKMSKASMRTLIPRFNSLRMFMDYVKNFYVHARNQSKILAANNAQGANQLAEWKKKIREAWPKAGMKLVNKPPTCIHYNHRFVIEIKVNLGVLTPEDVVVECLTNDAMEDTLATQHNYLFSKVTRVADGEYQFSLEMTPESTGLHYFEVRMYPSHPLLSHKFEMGCMIWL
jgi:starch phosphorylase